MPTPNRERARLRYRARRYVASALTVLAILGARPAIGEEGIDFAREVAPLLTNRCLGCHSPSLRKGDLSLATREPLVEAGFLVPGAADASYLLDVVSPNGDEPPRMPLEGAPLSAEESATLRAWIDAGAEWPEDMVLHEPSKGDANWWSLQPRVVVEPPSIDAAPSGWNEHPVDRFVAEKLAERGLAPNPPADRATLIRRVTYDLTGLPPTPEEIGTFVADESPDAYERLVERLLASPRYGERWGRHWLDVVRFGESRGFERNEIIDNLWPFRDYVIDAFNDDRPFDRVIREHLAGDVLAPDDPASQIASAFLVAGPYDDVGNQDPVQAAQIRANTIDEMIRTSSEAFLGLTVGCARCHDHKFDPIRQTDYYSLYATFAGVRHGTRELAGASERTARAERLAPLEARRDELSKAKAELQVDVDRRADERASELEAIWTRPAIARALTEETFPAIEAKFIRLVVDGTEANPAARSGHRIDEFEVWSAGDAPRNVALASEGAVARGETGRVAQDFPDAYAVSLVNDGQFGARWHAAGPDLTIELSQPTEIDRVVFSSDRPGAAPTANVALFVSEYRLFASLDGETWTEVASSVDRQPIDENHRRHRLREAVTTDDDRRRQGEIDAELQEVNRQIAAVPGFPVYWLGTREPAAGPFHVMLGGDPQRPGDEVAAASLRVIDANVEPYRAPDGASEGDRRKAFAAWATDADHPLTARVLANRIWHYHFGAGIVPTPSDFGYLGEPPTHAELLDWLAERLVEEDWRLKPIHRLIVTSQAYRQSSEWREEAASKDADSRYLWRFPPRRLSSEEVRDSLLQVADALDLRMGGRGFRLYQYLQDNVATYVPLDEVGPETYRRAVYHQNARAAPVDLMSEFDSPDCSFSTPRRAETTTPLQALATLNHDFTLDVAELFALRLIAEAPDDPAAQVERAFRLTMHRDPTDEERAACVALVHEYGAPALGRALFNASEFLYVP